MKLLKIVLFISMTVCIICEDLQQQVFDAVEGCTIKTNADAVHIKSILDGHHVPAEDDHFVPYLHCIFQKLELQAPDGTINFEHIKNDSFDLFQYVGHIEDPVGKVEKCESKHIKGNSPDNTLYLNFKCFIED